MIRKLLAFGITGLAVANTAWGALTLASNGEARVAVYIQSTATETEQWAARDLTNYLNKISGAPFDLKVIDGDLPAEAIIVGVNPASQAICPDANLTQLGDEEIFIYCKNGKLLLAGGKPRGTLYAVSRFLQEVCGVRWWTPWAEQVPQQKSFKINDMQIKYKPAFESRDPFWYMAFNRDWAVRNNSNSQSAHIPENMGGSIKYKGFVHTFYPLVPPDKYFKDHPEWYSQVKGKRIEKNGQLCLTNPDLRDFVVEKVREWLKETPEARIISISQNDWYGGCECEKCAAFDNTEGSKVGTMLDFVNYIAEKLASEFPQVAFDTLAYQYTRKAPKNVKPRPSVIVRLCSIECNFGVPLDYPANASFAKDMKDWSAVSQRIYVWDYTTDFAHYLQPHPNWYSLGPNVRFFHRHNVKGLFEQGAYQSHGAEMAEMRAWVLAQLLWNPYQDDRLLIKEFLNGYYGTEPARYIQEYLDLMFQHSRGFNLTCFTRLDTPFLSFKPLQAAENLWNKAEAAAGDNAELLRRIKIGHLAVTYAWLARWDKLKEECAKLEEKWPFNKPMPEIAQEWLTTAKAPGPEGWKPITHLNESGLTPDAFVDRLKRDVKKP